MTTSCAIHGLGFHVPERVLTNADLEKMVETSDEWITTRTGIKERRIAAAGTACSDLALGAARKALAAAGLAADDLTHIIVATLTPDAYVPSTACILEYKLGTTRKVAFDLNAACSGFSYALEQARAICCLHPEALVLIIGAEILSTRTNWADRSTCVLFGDGAGAAILGGAARGPGLGRLEDVLLSSDGSIWPMLTVIGGGSMHPYAKGECIGDEFFVHMDGREVYKHAVRNMEAVTEAILAKHGLTFADIDLFIPHQANLRIIEGVTKRFGLPADKVYINVDRYGNTSAASVPIAMAEAYAQGRIPPGARVVVTTFGGGFTWGASLLRF